MIKTYKANTAISINVVLASKKNLHIAFVPHSNGTSTYITNNADVQNAIESHYNFNKLFRLESSVEDNPTKVAKGKKVPTPTPEPEPTPTAGEEIKDETIQGEGVETVKEVTDETTDVEGEEIPVENEEDADGDDDAPKLLKVPVTDLDSAKDYLADKFGISRTKLKSEKTILAQAAAHGIEFVGLS